MKQCLSTFDAISVREEAAKRIVEENTGRTDVEVLIDPSNCFAVFLFGAAISVLFTPLYKVAFDFDEYIWIFVALLVLRTFNQVFSEYFRAVNQNVKFTIFGLITTATILGFNVVFLLFLKLGIRGYLYATLLSAAVGTLYILIFSDFFQVSPSKQPQSLQK